jgi:hypothetical protein
LVILDTSGQNNDLETLTHAPMDLNGSKYSTGNLEVAEVTGSSVYWLTTMKIDKEKHGFPVHILHSAISVNVFVFPVKVFFSLPLFCIFIYDGPVFSIQNYPM